MGGGEVRDIVADRIDAGTIGPIRLPVALPTVP
jgi:hypothetical protein